MGVLVRPVPRRDARPRGHLEALLWPRPDGARPQRRGREDDAVAFIHKYKLTYPSLRDGSQKTKQQFGYTGVPETFLVDKNGKVALYVPGPLTPADISGFDQVVNPLLKT